MRDEKESSDLSKREPLASNLDNRERAFRYSITRIPYLFPIRNLKLRLLWFRFRHLRLNF